ncbi:MAG: response regulator transcription factor [Nitrosomonas sp.]|nr:MAG: response regulator transcription factor [Nitrosomonas sp.]
MILLASANEELILRWQHGLFGISSWYVVHSYASLAGKINKVNPQIVFLDYELAGLRNQQSILDLLTLRKDTKVVIFAPELSDEIEWKLFKLGIKGCCLNNIQSGQIKRVVNAILHDELWIRRTLTNKILNELVKVTSEKNQMERTINNLLDNLTRREYEIAMLVGRGESNKRIAQQLTITERTVKAHLTEIFRKLHISDRIKLALIMKDASKSV